MFSMCYILNTATRKKKMLTTLMNMMRKPTARELAVRELEEAKRELLQAQTSRDSSAAVVDYQLARIRRLKDLLEGGEL